MPVEGRWMVRLTVVPGSPRNILTTSVRSSLFDAFAFDLDDVVAS